MKPQLLDLTALVLPNKMPPGGKLKQKVMNHRKEFTAAASKKTRARKLGSPLHEEWGKKTVHVRELQ